MALFVVWLLLGVVDVAVAPLGGVVVVWLLLHVARCVSSWHCLVFGVFVVGVVVAVVVCCLAVVWLSFGCCLVAVCL